MKTLILVRHAKSQHEEYVHRDIERHLAPRGYTDAGEVAAWCLAHSIKPQLFITSPSVRTYSTALIFANAYSAHPDQIVLNRGIYEAELKQLLLVIDGLDDEFDRVMMFGHNPGITTLLNYLCGPGCDSMPTAGVAVIRMDIDSWKEVTQASGFLEATSF